MSKKWAIYNRHGQHMTLKTFNEETGQLEDMDYYMSPEVAQEALRLMDDEDILTHGAHIREVTQA